MNYFKEKPNAPDTTHDCCDACRESCDCETCSSEQLSPDKEEVSQPLPTLSRAVEEDERHFANCERRFHQKQALSALFLVVLSYQQNLIRK